MHIKVLSSSQVRDHSAGPGRCGEAGAGGGHQTATGERSFAGAEKARPGCREPSAAVAAEGEAVGGRGAAQLHLSEREPHPEPEAAGR